MSTLGALGDRVPGLAFVTRDRDVMLAFIAGLVVAICFRDPADGLFSQLSADLLREHSGIGAGELLALAVLGTLAFRFRGESLLTRNDLAVVAVASLAFALPSLRAAGIPVTLVGLKLVFGSDLRVRSFGQILLALAFYEWFGPLIFHLLSPSVLRVETIAVQAVLTPIGGFARDGLVISPGGRGDFGLVIDEGCSAFHNVSLASLICISLVKLETLTLKAAHLWICAAMAAATVVLNHRAARSDGAVLSHVSLLAQRRGNSDRVGRNARRNADHLPRRPSRHGDTLTGSLRALRAVAFVLVALAALMGLITRIMAVKPLAPSFAGVESLNLSPGQPFGHATFDGIVSESVPSVRLRTTHCKEPIYAAPLKIRAVAEVELADRAYLDHPGYGVTNVYRGQVRQTFSHLDRFLARNPLTPYRVDYFIRFYAPSDCVIDDQAYVEWAGMILAMGTMSPLSARGG